jgi:hypothetical protein
MPRERESEGSLGGSVKIVEVSAVKLLMRRRPAKTGILCHVTQIIVETYWTVKLESDSAWGMGKTFRRIAVASTRSAGSPRSAGNGWFS